MPPTVPDGSTMGTPLAPSVEKAYYRKCIELKRRLNEVEASNDEARLRRIRLDRAIMKMRLERAFLLEQLSKRMDIDADNSDASGDEGVSTPPPDRPHRDKKRKTGDEPGAAPSSSIKPLASPTHPSAGEMPQATNIDRTAGTVGEALEGGPSIVTDSNGQRRVLSGSNDTPA